MSFLSHEQVLKFLPHREPFLFVDTISSIELPEETNINSLSINDFKPLIGGEVVSEFNVHKGLSCFEGHFPGKPVFPGVLQVEMMAQACAFLMTACKQYQLDDTEIEVAFLRVDQVRFRKMVIPPMNLTTKATLQKVRRDICQFECEIYCGEDLVSEGEIMASLKFIK